jgi:hypothetical protein
VSEFIFIALLLTKFESTNLMSLNDKWTFGTRTLLIAPEPYAEMARCPNGFTPNPYFLSLRLGKTFTLGIQGAGNIYRSSPPNHHFRWNGSVGVSLSKYFRAGNSLSPFITITPNFSASNHYNYYDYIYRIYGLNLDAGVEYFFTCWGKNLSLQLKTPLIKATRMYNKENNSSPYSSTDKIDFYSPLEGNLTSYLCLHF